MCRSIKVLRRPGQSATDEELYNAALQFVRKISGFHKPSKVNEEAFLQAVDEVAEASCTSARNDSTGKDGFGIVGIGVLRPLECVG